MQERCHGPNSRIIAISGLGRSPGGCGTGTHDDCWAGEALRNRSPLKWTTATRIALAATSAATPNHTLRMLSPTPCPPAGFYQKQLLLQEKKNQGIIGFWRTTRQLSKLKSSCASSP